MTPERRYDPSDTEAVEHTGDPHVAEDLAPDLAGDLGVSSERVDPDTGVEGTGSLASTEGRTAGASATHPGEDAPTPRTVTPGVPDDELDHNPADVPGHDSDPTRNPGHSHG